MEARGAHGQPEGQVRRPEGHTASPSARSGGPADTGALTSYFAIQESLHGTRLGDTFHIFSAFAPSPSEILLTLSGWGCVP